MYTFRSELQKKMTKIASTLDLMVLAAKSFHRHGSVKIRSGSTQRGISLIQPLTLTQDTSKAPSVLVFYIIYARMSVYINDEYDIF